MKKKKKGHLSRNLSRLFSPPRRKKMKETNKEGHLKMSSSFSPLPSKPLYGAQPHARSISLPSRLHPTSLRVEEQLNKLKSWQSSSISLGPRGVDAIQIGLVCLAELYVSMEDLIRSPSTQQALLWHEQGKLVDDALEGSIGFINILSTVRDLVSEMKDRTRDVQSTLRRRGGSIEKSSSSYVGFRKKSKKEIAKGFRELKQMDGKLYGLSSPFLLDTDPYLAMVVRVMREVVEMTTTVFRSLLDSLSVPAIKGKGWSVLKSKLVVGGFSSTLSASASSSSSSKRLEILNEVGRVDVNLCSVGCMCKDSDNVQSSLKKLDNGLQNLEGALDVLFRHLVQNRVSLMNILSTH